MSIEIGIKGRAEDVVREENTAQAVGSGTPARLCPPRHDRPHGEGRLDLPGPLSR